MGAQCGLHHSLGSSLQRLRQACLQCLQFTHHRCPAWTHLLHHKPCHPCLSPLRPELSSVITQESDLMATFISQLPCNPSINLEGSVLGILSTQINLLSESVLHPIQAHPHLRPPNTFPHFHCHPLWPPNKAVARGILLECRSDHLTQRNDKAHKVMASKHTLCSSQPSSPLDCLMFLKQARSRFGPWRFAVAFPRHHSAQVHPQGSFLPPSAGNVLPIVSRHQLQFILVSFFNGIDSNVA